MWMGLAKDISFHIYIRESMEDRIDISVPLRQDLMEMLTEEARRQGVDESTLATKIVIEHLLHVKEAAKSGTGNRRPGGGCFIIE
jgi:hypothetical protein